MDLERHSLVEQTKLSSRSGGIGVVLVDLVLFVAFFSRVFLFFYGVDCLSRSGGDRLCPCSCLFVARVGGSVSNFLVCVKAVAFAHLCGSVCRCHHTHCFVLGSSPRLIHTCCKFVRSTIKCEHRIML